MSIQPPAHDDSRVPSENRSFCEQTGAHYPNKKGGERFDVGSEEEGPKGESDECVSEVDNNHSDEKPLEQVAVRKMETETARSAAEGENDSGVFSCESESNDHGNEEYDETEDNPTDSYCIARLDAKPHVCPVCKKAYSHRSALYKHKRSHAEQFRFPCEICGKRFMHKNYLNIHAITHTDERPYSCEICGSAFRDRSARNKHVQAHSGVKPFSCEVCGKCFLRKGDYKSHLLVHTEERPYVCTVCGRAFRSSSNCYRHTRTHSDSCPYKCEECGKAFNQSWKLKEHKYVHTKQLPYVCDQCGMSFRYSGKYKTHVENHARERLHSSAFYDARQEDTSLEIIDVKPDICSIIGQMD